MKLESGKISGSQLIFLAMGFIFGTSDIVIPVQAARQMGWLTVLSGALEALVFAAIFTALAMRFRGKTLIEFNDMIYGALFGKIISLLYIWYFLHLASLNMKFINDFFMAIIYPETPLVVLMIFLTLICASAVRNGLEVIARCSVLLTIFTIFFYIADTLMLLKESDVSNLLPFMGISWRAFLLSSHRAATLPFGETVVFIMIFAFLNKHTEAKKINLAIILAAIAVSMVTARNTAVLGNLTYIVTYPSFMALRQINIGEILNRMELTVTIMFLSMAFVKISLLYYTTALGIAQLFHLRSYLPLVLPLGAIIIALGMINFDNTIQDIYFSANFYPIYCLPFQIGFPLLSLIIAVIRGIPKKEP